MLLILSALIALSALVIPVQAITNGQPDGTNHPYVVLVVCDIVPGAPAWRGSGILLSPNVVLTAGHITDGAAAVRIWKDEIVQGNPEYPYSGATSYDGTAYTHPDFAIGNFPGLPGWITHDVGIVVLSEPAAVSRYGQLPSVGLTETLPVMTGVDFVGYGVQVNKRGGGQPDWTGLRNRFYAPGQLLSTKSAISGEFITCTANPAQGKGGTAFGDSGGPVLLGGTDTVLAVTSFGTNNNCAGIGYYCRVDNQDILSWIKSFLP